MWITSSVMWMNNRQETTAMPARWCCEEGGVLKEVVALAYQVSLYCLGYDSLERANL